MEILMNIKCSANGNPSIQPTLKVVDQHQQLQQQHNPLKSQRPTTVHNSALHGKPATNPARDVASMLPFMEYPSAAAAAAATPMDCCSAAANSKNIADLQWAHAAHKRSTACHAIGMNPASSHCPPFCEWASCCAGIPDMLACCASYNNSTAPHVARSFLETCSPLSNFNQHGGNDASSFEYHEPEENFVSIEDEKIKAFLLKVGEEQKLEKNQMKKPTIPTDEGKRRDKAIEEEPVVFEIIDLDDVDERERLQRIRASAEERAKQQIILSERAAGAVAAAAEHSFVKKRQNKDKRKSPSISLIPKNQEQKSTTNKKQKEEPPQKSKEKIIARIDLLDSDSDSDSEKDENFQKNNSTIGFTHSNNDNEFDGENDDLVSSKLIAAATVTCELGCDDDNDQQQSSQLRQKNKINDSSSAVYEQAFELHSDDEDNIEFIEEQEEGLELRWGDLEDHNTNSRDRQFECPVCGKKVQSNYNLRRHMMIHTGERPFGCDLCERRFREISDLKKHRRRHASEKDFVCMICRINPPLETDSTRCSTCDTKNGTLIAAVRPDTVKTPPEIEQMFGTSLRADKRKLNLQSNSNLTSCAAERTLISPPTNLPNLTPIPPTKLNLDMPRHQTENIISKMIVNCPSNPPTLRKCHAMPRKEFACPMCKRAFGTRHNLKRHFMIHTGEKPFDCPSCRKPFREYSTLKKHLVTHRRDRWYKCSRCPQKYRDYLDYMDHKSTHGSDASSDDGSVTPKKRYKYQNDDQEDAYYSNDDDEDDDDASALGDCLECCECGVRFTDIDQFTEHIKEHDSNRIVYECYMCKQLFEDHKDLIEHMNVKHQVEEQENDEKVYEE